MYVIVTNINQVIYLSNICIFKRKKQFPEIQDLTKFNCSISALYSETNIINNY